MKRFKKVYIEITNICNLSCEFCPKTKRKLSFMSEESFREVIKKVKPYTDYVYFHLMGEPLLNKEINKFLDICDEFDLKANITTNGTLLKENKDILLKSKALRQVNISLHSFEANDSNIELEQYIKEIVDFAKRAQKESNIITALRLWNMDTEELKASNGLNTNIFNILEEGLNIDYSIAEKLLEVDRMKLGDRIYLNMAEKFEWPDILKIDTDEEVFCYGLRDQIGIHVDGTVVPCCLDSEGNIPLGNIFNESLDKIINSKRATDLYDGFSRRCAVEELCQKCGYAKRYKK